MEVKKEPKMRMAATRPNLFLRSKIKTNPSDPKVEVSNLKASFKKQADKIQLDSHEIAPDGRRQNDGFFFFFVKISFSSIKSPNSSRKSIILFFLNH
jgi:hypothetical protein